MSGTQRLAIAVFGLAIMAAGAVGCFAILEVGRRLGAEGGISGALIAGLSLIPPGVALLIGGRKIVSAFVPIKRISVALRARRVVVVVAAVAAYEVALFSGASEAVRGAILLAGLLAVGVDVAATRRHGPS